MSDTSENPVQNKVVNKYVEQVVSELTKTIEEVCKLYTELPEDTNGFNIFSQNNGLHVFSVNTNINAPKETKETYFVVVIQNQYFITQTWYSLYFDGDVFFIHCEIQRDWRWSPFRKITP